MPQNPYLESLGGGEVTGSLVLVDSISVQLVKRSDVAREARGKQRQCAV